METNNQKPPEEKELTVMFFRKKPINPSISSTKNKVFSLFRKIVILAFWILVIYFIFEGIVVPTMNGCNIIGTWNC